MVNDNFAFGVDISRYNTSPDGRTKVDFDRIAAHDPKVVFIAIRTGVSWGYQDPWFAYYFAEAGRIVLQGAVWDEAAQGIRATLAAFGPGAAVLTALGEQILAGEDPPGGKVGFSADVLFAGRNRVVEKILKVFSVDLVYDPARGGAFLRQLNQSDDQIGGLQMAEQVKAPVPAAETGEDVTAVAQETQAVRLQMCGYLLETALSASNLPKPVISRLRKQFDGQVFEAGELQQAIEDARTMVGELTGASVVNGPGRITEMVTSEERLQTAVDDLFGLPRAQGKQNVFGGPTVRHPGTLPDPDGGFGHARRLFPQSDPTGDHGRFYRAGEERAQ